MLHKTLAAKKPIYIHIIYISQIHYWNWIDLNIKINQCNKIQYKNSIAQFNLITVHQLCIVNSLSITEIYKLLCLKFILCTYFEFQYFFTITGEVSFLKIWTFYTVFTWHKFT